MCIYRRGPRQRKYILCHRVFLGSEQRGIRPVVAAALGFDIQGMAFVAKGRLQYAPCIGSGIRWLLEGGESRKQRKRHPIDTTSVKVIPDARGLPTETESETVLLDHPAPSAISPVDT
jgi:hypothetical protein